jgi:hypothetical protein
MSGVGGRKRNLVTIKMTEHLVAPSGEDGKDGVVVRRDTTVN